MGLTSVYPPPMQTGIFNAGLLLRYMLEKCQDVSEAVSCLYHLPIASAQDIYYGRHNRKKRSRRM